MVKRRKKHSRKNHASKGFQGSVGNPRRINASTEYETCTEQLSPFGGLLGAIKFLDLVEFKEIFHFAYRAPTRKPKLGHYLMVVGILMLLFIGFNRIWHFTYVRLDALLCSSIFLHNLYMQRIVFFFNDLFKYISAFVFFTISIVYEANII